MISEVYEIPFRELWMREGLQTFDPLVTARDRLSARRGPSDHLRRLQPALRQGAGQPHSSSPSSRRWRVRASASSTRSPRGAGDEGELARAGASPGASARIVAVGGDGTWSNVASAILRSGQPAALGLVPGGTGCDLAKSLGIPAKDVAAAGRHRRTTGTARDRRRPGRGQALPERGRVRLRHRGARELLEGPLTFGRPPLPVLRARQLGIVPGLPGRDRGGRAAARTARAADAGARQRRVSSAAGSRSRQEPTSPTAGST